jgi:hypothetical protein
MPCISLQATEELDDKVRSQDMTITGLKDETSTLTAELSTVRDKLSALRDREIETRTKGSEFAAKVVVLEAEVAKLSSTNDWYQSELEAATAAHSMADKNGKSVASDLSTANEALSAELEVIKRTISTAASKLTQEMSARSAADTEIKKLEAQMKSLQTSEAEARMVASALEVSIGELNDKLKAAGQEESERLQVVAGMEAAVAASQQAVTAAEQENVLALKTAEQESAMMAQASERAVLGERQTSERLAAEEATTAKLKSEVATLSKQLATESEQVDALTERLVTATRSAEEKAAASIAVEVARSTAESRSDALAAELAAATTLHTAAAAARNREAEDAINKAEVATVETVRLERALADSEAQRKLDQKKSTMSLRDLSKQLQRLEASQGSGAAPRRSSPTSSTASSATKPNSPGPAAAGSGGLASESSLKHASAALTGPGGRAGGTRQQGASPPRNISGGQHGLQWHKERLQFYESHSEELTADLKGKSKIIQMYLLRDQKGKLEPRRKGQESTKAPPPTSTFGSMTAAFSSKPKTVNGITLELALEMNTRLQQVTEDALLKNIQLQESLDVLSSQLSP